MTRRRRSLDHVWAEVRYRVQIGAITSEEMQTFARLTRDPELIRESAMDIGEFFQYVIQNGGEWPAPPNRLHVI